MGQLPFEKKKREILVKREEKGELGILPEERTTEVLLNYSMITIDKPKGPTSHQVAEFVKKITKSKKTGHSGTLDPIVTGLLPVAIGATRIVQTLLNSGKEYICIMHMHDLFKQNDIKKTFKKMGGKIKQLPPIKSAIKRQERYRTIYYTEILEIDGQDILYRIGCQGGTYIRKYCHDFGQALNSGAHMQELRRTKAGPFDESKLVTLQDLEDAMHYYKNGDDSYLRKILLPIESAVDHIPHVWVSDSAISSLINGVNLKVPGIVRVHSGIEPDQMVALLTLKGELIGLGTAVLSSSKMMKLDKGVAVKASKIFNRIGF